MIIAPERFASRRDTLAFVVCTLLSITARVAPSELQHAVASSIRNTVLAPFLAIQNQAVLMRTSRSRLTSITEQRDSMALRVLEIFALQEDNEQLRRLLALSARVPVPHVAAEVLHLGFAADALTLVLSAGRNHGVEPMAPVVAPGGLVGVIRSTAARTSVALVWTHPDFRASAMTADGSVFGIVAPHGSEGPNTMLMELRGVPYRESVSAGSWVYTSGLGSALGGVYPRGIPIGTVIAVGEEREGWSRTYVVRPAVHPASISHVIILTGIGENVAAAFEADSL